MYTKDISDDKIYVILYVDDIIIASKDIKHILNMHRRLSNYFELTDLGDISYYLGIEVKKDKDEIYN